MDIDRFKASPVGHLVPINGHDAYLQRDYRHYAFVPCPAPTTIALSQGTYNSVSKAALALGRLDFAVRRLPDPRLLIRPVLRREAQSTSELEGTYAPLAEVLAADFINEARRSAELREVMNYVVAAERAFELIKTFPICLRVLCQLQAILVRGTRGQMYDSGQLRQRQVFIGERELGIEESRFVPVPEGDLLQNGVSDWEKWINAQDDDMALVVKAAVGHYQFETLHPRRAAAARRQQLIRVSRRLGRADTRCLAYRRCRPGRPERTPPWPAPLWDAAFSRDVAARSVRSPPVVESALELNGRWSKSSVPSRLQRTLAASLSGTGLSPAC